MWNPGFVKLLHSVEGIASGASEDLSKGCLYWADLGKIDSPWFKEHILGNPNHPRLVDMGSLVFFKQRKYD